MQIKLFTLITSLIFLLLPSLAYADGFRIPPQGAAAGGQANAVVAQADDPSAIHYNPAGLTQLQGLQLYYGVSLVGGETKFRNASGVTARGDLGGSIANPPPTNFYIAANLKDLGIEPLNGLSLGLGVTTPFGLLIRYPNDGAFATAITSAALPLLDIKPTAAIRLTDDLSFGFGADIYTFASFIGHGHIEQKLNWPGGGGIPAGTPTEISGTGNTVGFNVSALYTLLRHPDGKPRVNLGVVYKSRANLPIQGQFLLNGTATADASATFVLPEVLTGGIAFWPVRSERAEWKIEADVTYVGWESFERLDIRLSNGAVLAFPQNWRNVVGPLFGTEYKWLRLSRLAAWEVAMRGGYGFIETPVPDRTFSPLVADANQHVFAVGAGVLCKISGKFLGLIPCGSAGAKALGLDVAYQFVYDVPRTISGNLNPTVNGEYKTVYHFGSINFRVNF